MSGGSFGHRTTRPCHTPDHPTSPHHHGTGGAVVGVHRHPGCPWDCGVAVYARSPFVSTADPDTDLADRIARTIENVISTSSDWGDYMDAARDIIDEVRGDTE